VVGVPGLTGDVVGGACLAGDVVGVPGVTGDVVGASALTGEADGVPAGDVVGGFTGEPDGETVGSGGAAQPPHVKHASALRAPLPL